MTRTKILTLAITAAVISTTLNGANVSIVNQPASGTSSGTAPTSTPGGTSPQQNPASTKAVGKLPASTGAGGGHASRKPKLEVQEPVKFVEQPTYTFPGLLAKIGKRWVGSDYLYNMHKNIGVKVEVVRQEGKDISVDEEGIAQIVSDIFLTGNIVPDSFASEESPPLPFFHVLIFALPADNNNIAFVSGRLFEDALLARYGLDPIGTWQAISWEKQDLVVTSPLQFDEQLKKSVAGIAQTFVDRVEMYAKIKEEAESNAKLYYPSAIPRPPKAKPTTPPPAPKEPVIEQINPTPTTTLPRIRSSGG